MRALAAIAAVVAAATLPTAAAAKGFATVRVCGPESCATLDDRALASRVASPQETVDPPAASSYYRLDILFEAGDASSSYSTLFVPAEGLIASNAGGLLWYVPRTDALGALRAAIADLEPFAAPRAWPRYIESPDPRVQLPTAAADGGSRLPVGLAGAALLLALVVGLSVVVRRQRLPRPSRA